MWGIFNSCIILVFMIRSVFCSQICSELEFPEISKNTIYATDGTNVSLHFHLNTKQCSKIPDEFIIKVLTDRNGSLLDLCRIRLKVAEKSCTLSDSSKSCYCPSSDGRMLFLKQVTKDDEGVYVWRWNENFQKEVQKNLTLKVKGPDPKSRDTMTTLSTPDAEPRAVPDAKQPEVEVASAIIPRASHQQDAENALDTRLIVSSAILAGVVVVAVIGAVLIFCLRGQRRNNQTHSSSVEGVTKNSYQLPSAPSVPREQASDIYDEIPDRAKLQNAGSRGCPPNTSALHSQSSSVSITQMESLVSGKAHSPESSVEYLSPVSVCTEQKG